jgi:hypothetical protein
MLNVKETPYVLNFLLSQVVKKNYLKNIHKSTCFAAFASFAIRVATYDDFKHLKPEFR